MPGSTRRSVPGVLGAVAACEAVGGVSGLAARKGISQWLPTLERPPFQPPDGVFGPVWTILYALIGISWYLVRTAPTETTPTGATPAGETGGPEAAPVDPDVGPGPARRRASARQRADAERWMAIHLALNGLWSVLFFGRRRPGLALLDSVALVVAVAVATVKVSRISRIAGALLLPYLVWVSFATVLNAELWRRNPGSTGRRP